MEERKETLCSELQEEIEAVSLLLDDRLYTNESYLGLVTAVGCAKAALADEKSDEAVLEVALAELHHAADAMETCESKEEAKRHDRKKRDLTPLLLVGAFCGGLLLGSRLVKKRKNGKGKS